MPKENERTKSGAVAVLNGEVVTRADLPPSHERRWGPKQKARVVAAVEAGLLSLGEARKRYELSVEEFISWQRALHAHGMQGLKTFALSLGDSAARLRNKRRRRSPNTGNLSSTVSAGGRHV